MKKFKVSENQIGLFEFLNQKEQQEKLDQLEEPNEDIVEGKDCWLGYEASVDASILIHDYEFKRERQYSYEIHNHLGFIYIGKQKIYIDIWHAEPPALDNRYCLTLYDMNELPLPNCKYHYDVLYFKDLENLIKFIKSEFTDKSLIYDQDEFYKESNGWRYDKKNLKRKKKEIIEEEQEEDW